MRSSPNNRIGAIMAALLDAHDDAQRLSRSSLHRMPEFFMATRVADYFAAHFDNFGYRLEAQVKRTFEASDMPLDDIAELLQHPDLRPDGRFDLVLHTGKRGRTAHILEFKRGDAMRGLISDIRRLAKVCRHAGRHSLKTNYLVLTRRCPPERDTTGRLIERLDMALHTAGLDDLDVNLIASEPQQPFLNQDHLPMANRAFQIVILEVQG
ncbi:hypothetical protein [Halomonas litopenaei]|uniref:hypothetical protein n=1 Tax=Halomonas litopenaei TaxID=2109328 RepID=UPI003FA0F76F